MDSICADCHNQWIDLYDVVFRAIKRASPNRRMALVHYTTQTIMDSIAPEDVQLILGPHAHCVKKCRCVANAQRSGGFATSPTQGSGGAGGGCGWATPVEVTTVTVVGGGGGSGSPNAGGDTSFGYGGS